MIAALPLSVSAAGEYVPGNPRWSGYQNQVQWGRPAGAASGDSFEYEAQLLLGDDVVESKAVEIDTYLFFTNDVVTRPQEEYTIRVRARWIMIVGDPDGQYMVADVGEAEPPHEHSYTQKHDAAQHWQACSCGERLNVAKHSYGDWRETKPATETEAGSRERDCTVCDYVQTETIPMLEHEHSYGDWQKDETQHWKECRCGEKTEVGNHTFDDWTITKEPTTTETGSRERTCSICKYTQEETIPVHEHSIHDEAWKYDDILFSTHITSDLDKCADDITYIQNGCVLKSAGKDTFLHSFEHLKMPEDTGPLTLEEIMLRTERSEWDDDAAV